MALFSNREPTGRLSRGDPLPPLLLVKSPSGIPGRSERKERGKLSPVLPLGEWRSESRSMLPIPSVWTKLCLPEKERGLLDKGLALVIRGTACGCFSPSTGPATELDASDGLSQGWCASLLRPGPCSTRGFLVATFLPACGSIIMDLRRTKPAPSCAGVEFAASGIVMVMAASTSSAATFFTSSFCSVRRPRRICRYILAPLSTGADGGGGGSCTTG